MTTPRLGAPELSTSQASKEATVNEAVRYIEAGAGHFIFKDRDLATPPGSPADGDCYLVAASPTGAWSGQAGKIAFRVNTAWAFITAIEGFTAWVNDEDAFVQFDGAAWNIFAAAAGAYIPTSYLDTDGALAANSDSKVATQKATKAYVDAKVAGLSWKQAVRVATTANGTLATAFENGDTVDGVTLATGDRILIKDQSSGAENGIYTVNASGAPTRATDADSGAELVNASVYVSEGTTNADTQWVCTTNATITIGSTSLTFAQINTSSTVFASAAEIQAGTVSTKAVAPDKLHDAHAPQTLTDGATISWDMAAGFNAKVTLGGNRTLGTPTNPKVGLTYVLEVIQDATGTRLMTWPASFNWGSAGTPTLSTTAAKVDIVTLYCRDAATPKFRAVFNKDA